MGGDDAPAATVAGALLAADPSSADALAPESLVLVGDRERLEHELAERGGNPGFEVVHASQVIEMDDKPAVALRAKPDASILTCMRLVREQAAGALVGMGNTGAVVGAATLGLKTLPGVKRPGIAVTTLLTGKPLTFLDMGANIAAKPEHLLQYGQMGAVYARRCLATETPRVGLLNIGGEPTKGTELMQQAHGLLAASALEFCGNIEGDEMFKHRADVMVMDGFTGNVVLKLLEGFSGFLMGLFMAELKAHQAEWAGESLAKLKGQIDYSSYGGALLLGVRAPVVIGHGRSDARAVANALQMARRTLSSGVTEAIVEGVSAGT